MTAAAPPRPWHLAVLVVLAALLAGCAASGTEVDEDASPRSTRNYITPEEVAGAITAENTYLLVQRLRPLWLRERGPKSILFDPGIIVYEGRMRFGTTESLRLIPTVHVSSVRFLPPDKATLIHGAGHPHGAIVVQVKSGPES